MKTKFISILFHPLTPMFNFYPPEDGALAWNE